MTAAFGDETASSMSLLPPDGAAAPSQVCLGSVSLMSIKLKVFPLVSASISGLPFHTQPQLTAYFRPFAWLKCCVSVARTAVFLALHFFYL